jgi:hypothetical protein
MRKKKEINLYSPAKSHAIPFAGRNKENQNHFRLQPSSFIRSFGTRFLSAEP